MVLEGERIQNKKYGTLDHPLFKKYLQAFYHPFKKDEKKEDNNSQ